jgi:hypothetical protein
MKHLVWVNLLTLSLYGQFDNTMQLEPGTSSPAASLSTMSWIQGAWIGKGLGGACEEVWSSPRGGSMLGTFRLMQENKLVFSEFMEIVEAGGSLLLRLKHFGSDFVGWEEKDKHVEFKLVKVTEDACYFDGLTYKKTGQHSMEVYVMVGSEDAPEEAKFSYTRML